MVEGDCEVCVYGGLWVSVDGMKRVCSGSHLAHRRTCGCLPCVLLLCNDSCGLHWTLVQW